MNIRSSCCGGCNGILSQRARLSVGLRRLSVTVQPRRPINRAGAMKIAAGKQSRIRKALEEGPADSSPTPSEPAISSDAEVKAPIPPSIPTNKALEGNSEEIETPNYALWIASLLAVIGTFYVVVFYAGAGFFYFLSQKVDFKRKDFVPYSETLRLRKEEEAAAIAKMKEEDELKSAPALTEEQEPHDAKDTSGIVASGAQVGAHDLPFQDFGSHHL